MIIAGADQLSGRSSNSNITHFCLCISQEVSLYQSEKSVLYRTTSIEIHTQQTVESTKYLTGVWHQRNCNCPVAFHSKMHPGSNHKKMFSNSSTYNKNL
jgi:hypothetical protein